MYLRKSRNFGIFIDDKLLDNSRALQILISTTTELITQGDIHTMSQIPNGTDDFMEVENVMRIANERWIQDNSQKITNYVSEERGLFPAAAEAGFSRIAGVVSLNKPLRPSLVNLSPTRGEGGKGS